MKRSIFFSHPFRLLRPRLILGMLSLVAVYLITCLQLSLALPFPHPINFEDLSLGAKYKCGQKFTTSGLAISVLPFQWGSKQLTKNGFATVDDQKFAGGTGKEMFTNNVNLGFDAKYPKGLSLRFRNRGGNVNIAINGEFRNIRDFKFINNTDIGKVHVSVKNQVLILKGVIDKAPFKVGRESFGDYSLVIGGQELSIDDVIPLK
jgi:hypothetical protein